MGKVRRPRIPPHPASRAPPKQTPLFFFKSSHRLTATRSPPSRHPQRGAAPTTKIVGMCARPGSRAAKSKPYRRTAGHKPMSKDQMEFYQQAAAEGKTVHGRAMGKASAQALAGDTAAGARGGAAGASGRSTKAKGKGKGAKNVDYTAMVVSEAEAQLAQRLANGRGGRGYIAMKGRNSKSDASLASLDLADEDTVRELLGRLPVGHVNERARLKTALEKNFARWWQLLQSEFSLLLYGFGSKKELLEDFANKMLTDGGVIVVNGYFPGLTPKQILAAAAAAVHPGTPSRDLHGTNTETLLAMIAEATSAPHLLAHQNKSAIAAKERGERASKRGGGGKDDEGGGDKNPLALANPEDLPGDGSLATTGAAQSYHPPRRLYIVLHNIDGQQLRSPEAQALLGELAAMPRVHLVSSVDHVNAPLLWSKREAARFNFVWQEATTFAPYKYETAHVPQMLASKGEERHVRGAVNVLRSLTSNARDIFRLLAEHQLANPESGGMTFHAFYTRCREEFLATSETTLKSHLTEFIDHELTRTKKGSEGIVIPFADEVIAQLLEQIKD